MKSTIYLLCLTAVLIAINLKAEYRSAGGKIKIHISNYGGNEVLALDTFAYKNSFGQLYKISKLKYYIGNIEIVKLDGKKILDNRYFLVDEENEQSKNILLENLPVSEFKEINFIIGVDSLHNCSGLQSGALDPRNGMFWTWNTGYVFFKLEGYSPASTSNANFFEYHIGGFQKPHNAIRRIHITRNESYFLSKEIETQVEIKFDVDEALKSPTDIDFSLLSSVTDFHNAATIANNYMNAFSFMKN